MTLSLTDTTETPKAIRVVVQNAEVVIRATLKADPESAGVSAAHSHILVDFGKCSALRVPQTDLICD